MGFFARLKKMFDSGGVKASIVADKTFRWSDDVLPVEITVRNSADEPRTVNSIRLQLVEHNREKPATTRKVHGRYEGLNMFVSEPVTIAAGGEHTLQVKMPLSLQGTADTIDAEAPGWLKGLSAAVNVAKEFTRDHEWYELRVIPEVEGFTATRIGTHRIRNLRTGEWGGGIFTTRVGR